jgi:hypothetical protein
MWNASIGAGHLVARVETSKADSTISQLGCGTSVACHGKPIKEEEEEEEVHQSVGTVLPIEHT